MVEQLGQEDNPMWPKAEDMVQLPAVDMAGPEDEIVRNIHQQMTTLGFLQLKNVAGFDEAALLADIKEFHQMPDSEKSKLYTK